MKNGFDIDINSFAAKRMKELRNKKNITQAELAEELNITQQQVARYENNLRKFKQNFLFQLADYFDTSINTFFPPTSSNCNNDINNDQILNEMKILKNFFKEKNLINIDGNLDLNRIIKLIELGEESEKHNQKRNENT